MKISVLFFARSRDLAGVNESTVDIREGGTTLDLVDTLLQQVRDVHSKQPLSTMFLCS